MLSLWSQNLGGGSMGEDGCGEGKNALDIEFGKNETGRGDRSAQGDVRPPLPAHSRFEAHT